MTTQNQSSSFYTVRNPQAAATAVRFNRLSAIEALGAGLYLTVGSVTLKDTGELCQYGLRFKAAQLPSLKEAWELCQAEVAKGAAWQAAVQTVIKDGLGVEIVPMTQDEIGAFRQRNGLNADGPGMANQTRGNASANRPTSYASV